MSTEKKPVLNTLETLKSIRARETTVGEVDLKVAHLIEELETKSEEAVLKSLVRSEVAQGADARQWKRNAFCGLGVSVLLLASVFGLTILSLLLAKDVYVSDTQGVGNQPAMMNTDGRVLAVASASKKWALSMAPLLPDHLLKTVTEVTMVTPWNSTLSLDILTREKFSEGILLQTPEDYVVVAESGATFLMMTKSLTNESAMPLPTLFPEEFPSGVLHLLKERKLGVGRIFRMCGALKCASFSVTEDDELTRKELSRRLSRQAKVDELTGKSRLLSHQIGTNVRVASDCTTANNNYYFTDYRAAFSDGNLDWGDNFAGMNRITITAMRALYAANTYNYNHARITASYPTSGYCYTIDLPDENGVAATTNTKGNFCIIQCTLRHDECYGLDWFPHISVCCFKSTYVSSVPAIPVYATVVSRAATDPFTSFNY